MEHTDSHRVPNDLAEVPGLREFFVQACRAAGVDGEELNAWMLVFTELVNNSMEHGCSDPTDCVDVYYSVSETSVELRVTDPGEAGPTLVDLLQRTTSDFAETGRGAGLILVRSFTDEVVVRPGENGGTEIRCVKYRGSQPEGAES